MNNNFNNTPNSHICNYIQEYPNGVVTNLVTYNKNTQEIVVVNKNNVYFPRNKKMWASIQGFLDIMMGIGNYSILTKKDLAVFGYLLRKLKYNNTVIEINRQEIITGIKNEYPNFYIDASVVTRSLMRLKKAGLIIDTGDKHTIKVNADLFCKGSLRKLHEMGELEANIP